MKRAAILFITLFSSAYVSAWDGSVTGKIYGVDVAAPGDNFGFRVGLDGGTVSMCGNDHKWAYINESDSNYETFVSVLLAAKMADKSVTIHSNRSGSNEYCHIGYIRMK